MGMRLSRLRDRLDPGVVADIDSSLDSLDRVVRQIRATIRALRDPIEPVGLVDRLHGEANRAHPALGFQPELQVEAGTGVDEYVPADLADDVVAVVREGLSNAARHAHASSIQVHVTLTPKEVAVEVRDDGAGLPVGLTRRSGLDNLGERARRHGGSCSAEPGAGGGTTLRWQVPLEE